MRRLCALPSSLVIGLAAFVVPSAGSAPRVPFQSNAVLQGRVLDQNGAVVPRARIAANNIATSLERVGETDGGFNRIYFTASAFAELNPADFGIADGVTRAIGLPQINIAGAINFGGPIQLPQGRGDTTIVFADTVSYLRGRHSLKFGGDFRLFYNNNFTQDTGSFTFPTVAAFLAGNANSFAITLSDRVNSVKQDAVGPFVQDSFKWRPNLTLELGLRYDLNMTPTERYDRFVVFDPATVSLLRVGADIAQPYHTNNLNFQRELLPNLAVMLGYFGSKGTHLRISRNINQPVNGVRPFLRLSASSPQLPGATIGNITQVEGSGNSSYNALWATITRRFSRGLQFNASYTWSKSIDYNSSSGQPGLVTVQNSYDLRNDRGLSDFDARHRLVVNGIYALPFKGNRFKEGWQLGTIVQLQTGNPVNLITTNSTVSGVVNTIRPDVAGPVEILGTVDRWFDINALTAVARFGSLGRNVIIGPGFSNIDFSTLKNTRLNEDVRLQFRAEVFDVLNHASFGQPGRVVGAGTFGAITNTRFPTGDSGSSRQLQFALKLMF